MRSQILTLTLLALVAGTPALAGDHDHGKSSGEGHGRAFCPHCGEACYPTVTKGKETRHCFETESKAICIPKVRFPWEKDCGKDSHGSGKCANGKDCDRCPDVNCLTPKCGRTRYVNVLIKHEYECTVCKYSWDPSNFKSDSKNEGKYLDAPEAAADEAALTPPSPVEARMSVSRDNLRSVSNVPPRVDIEPSQPETGRSGVSLFSRFFK